MSGSANGLDVAGTGHTRSSYVCDGRVACRAYVYVCAPFFKQGNSPRKERLLSREPWTRTAHPQ